MTYICPPNFVLSRILSSVLYYPSEQTQMRTPVRTIAIDVFERLHAAAVSFCCFEYLQMNPIINETRGFGRSVTAKLCI